MQDDYVKCEEVHLLKFDAFTDQNDICVVHVLPSRVVKPDTHSQEVETLSQIFPAQVSSYRANILCEILKQYYYSVQYFKMTYEKKLTILTYIVLSKGLIN